MMKRLRMIQGLVYLLGGALLAGSLPAYASSQGLYLLGNDPLEMGRAHSGLASPRNAYCMYTNPAGLVELERRIDVNACLLTPDVGVRPRGPVGCLFPERLHTDGFFGFPSGGVVWPTDHGTLGAGFWVPSGSAVKYEGGSLLESRILQGYSDGSFDFGQGRLVLAYAYRFKNGIAVGAGLDANFNLYRTNHFALNLEPEDSGWDLRPGLGFNLGVYRNWKRVGVALAYTSRQWSASTPNFSALLKYPLDLPPIVHAGAAFHITPKIDLTASYSFVEWRNVALYRKSIADLGMDWDNQHIVAAGLEWEALPWLSLRAGFSHANAPVSSAHVPNSLFTPGIVENQAAIGATFRFMKHHEVHLAFLHGFRHSVYGADEGNIVARLTRQTELYASAEYFGVGYSLLF